MGIDAYITSLSSHPNDRTHNWPVKTRHDVGVGFAPYEDLPGVRANSSTIMRRLHLKLRRMGERQSSRLCGFWCARVPHRLDCSGTWSPSRNIQAPTGPFNRMLETGYVQPAHAIFTR